MAEKNDLEKLDDLIAKSNDLKYKQSSKLSDICRYWMYALLGILWTMSYHDHKFEIPDALILATFIMVVVFHVVDIMHYLSATIFHHVESFYLDNNKNKSIKETEKVKKSDKHRRRVNSNISFILTLSKPILAITASLLFIFAIL